MVPPDSHRVSRAPRYSGYHYPQRSLPVRDCHPYRAAFQLLPVRHAGNVVVLQPQNCRNNSGLGCSGFARRYYRNHSCFLFLRLLRCFSSAGSPPSRGTWPSTKWVAPFGHPRINAHVQLPVDFRSLSRPSSPLRAQASPIRPSFACRIPQTNAGRPRNP